MAKLDKIRLFGSYNIVWAEEDQDSLTDYFPMYTGTLAYIISRIQEKGAQKITAYVVNNDTDIPAEKRIKQICKKCGYSYKNKSGMITDTIFDDHREYYHIEFELNKL